MGILRGELAFEGRFTQVPNEWARDESLSRRARGLLTEILSHRIGWRLSVEGLVKNGTEGRHAIRAAIDELRDAGYLVVEQGRGDRGQFGEVEYRLADPAVRKSDTGRFSDDGSADSGSADSGGSPTKEDHLQEHHPEEHDLTGTVVAGDARAPYSADVRRLSEVLAEAVRANGHKVGTVGQTWWAACDRLMRLDGYTAAQVEWMIAWATAHEFWAANIRSMPKLREKFSTLVLQAKREAGQSSGRRAASVVDLGRRLQESADAAERAS
ncbi:hypothetical protein QE428_002626 [Microbacterium sp. SORGH_AS 505]|uniref:hypothetical protein n=1 Tax=Microbacterium sp. SORGH_AS_0505 TaxID=3041770 RepID=UPI0027817EFF|nr:hypothetical protein [Microbacterium sp. SORGH_AS_0505]MDQ1127593.1 hypothetical protein [Microbacterium sp. SORGH_AS_0505]